MKTMMDRCSLDAYKDITKSGKIGSDQQTVLNVFKSLKGHMLTARDVYDMVFDKIDFNGVRSRITELTDGGLLVKVGKCQDKVSRKTVNCWMYKSNANNDLFNI